MRSLSKPQIVIPSLASVWLRWGMTVGGHGDTGVLLSPGGRLWERLATQNEHTSDEPFPEVLPDGSGSYLLDS